MGVPYYNNSGRSCGLLLNQTFLLGFIGNRQDPSTWESAMQSLSSPAYSFALGAAVTIFLVGIWLWVRNGSTIRRIKNEVKFDKQNRDPRIHSAAHRIAFRRPRFIGDEAAPEDHIRRNAGNRHPRAAGLLPRLQVQPHDEDRAGESRQVAPDDLRLSVIEPRFICTVCGLRGANIRGDRAPPRMGTRVANCKP